MVTLRIVALTVVATAMAALVACGGGDDETDAVATRGPTELNEVQESRSIRDLTDEGEVLEASMSQTATTAALELVVVDEVSETRAQELGSKFVRVVKQRGPDRQTGMLIGIGNVDYTITVKYSDDRTAAQGTKPRNDNTMTWK